MNALEGRFAQLKRLSQEEVDALHAAEAAADRLWRAAPDKPAQRGDGWKIASARFLLALNRVKPDFWSPRLPDADRRRAVDVFVHDKAVLKACALAKNLDRDELAALHEADLWAWRYAPALGVGAGDELRARAAAVY